jgi:hypothetical protein
MSRQGGLRTRPYPDPTIRHSPFAVFFRSRLAARCSPSLSIRHSPFTIRRLLIRQSRFFTIRYSRFAIRRFSLLAARCFSPFAIRHSPFFSARCSLLTVSFPGAAQAALRGDCALRIWSAAYGRNKEPADDPEADSGNSAFLGGEQAPRAAHPALS